MSESRGGAVYVYINHYGGVYPLFITGMMGPYMAPMAFNVPISVMVSTIVAFCYRGWQ